MRGNKIKRQSGRLKDIHIVGKKDRKTDKKTDRQKKREGSEKEEVEEVEE